MAVARLLSMPSTPTFASKAVAAANMAESIAQKIQVISFPWKKLDFYVIT